MIKCIIVDDEPLAAQLLLSYAEKIDELDVVDVFHNPLEALSLIQNQKIDLIFLDIQMPELKGTQLAKLVQEDTSIIFTTAYAAHAVEGFELNALDYLVKPVNFERFLQSILRYTKLKKTNPIPTSETSNTVNASIIFVKTEYRLQKLNLEDIAYFKSMGDYVQIITDTEKVMTLETMKSFEEKLPKNIFLRVHRSYLIAIKKIKFIQNNKIKILNELIPIGRTYLDIVNEKFSGL